MRLFKNAHGDTIVEVLIAMAVASAVIGSSYVVVNRTLANARQAQEHSAALEIANEQIERISNFVVSPADRAEVLSVSYHCASKTDGSLITQTTLNASTLDDESKYNTACLRSDLPQRYRTAFAYNTTTDVFTVTVTWAAATGNGNDRTTLLYKAYSNE